MPGAPGTKLATSASSHEKTPLMKKDEAEEETSLLRDPLGWVKALGESYSWRLLTMVALTSHLLKGFVAGGGDEGLIGKPAEFIFSDLGISAGRLQTLKAVTLVPFAMKPVVALLSDACPLFGYHKMPYVVLFSVMSFFAVTSLGFGLTTSESAVVAALFLAFLQVASVDVLMGAKQSQEIKRKASLGPEFITFNWLGINAGQVASVCVLGPMISVYGPYLPYRLAAPLVLIVLWPALGNFLGEERVEQRAEGPDVFRKHPILCLLTFMIGMLALALVMGTFLLEESMLIHLAAGVAFVVLSSFMLFIRWEITGPVTFFFLLGLLSFNIEGAMFYFCTDNAAEFPTGPHFTPHFYITGVGAASFIGITLGFMTGAELFKQWSYKSICIVTICLRVMTQLALIPLLRRWTGGSFDCVWLLSVAFLDNLVQAWRWIPKQVMAAHLAPRGVEATTLGLHAGTFNMASILSTYCGGYFLNYFGITPSGEHREGSEFLELWKVQCLASLAPLFLVFLIPILLPEKTQTEKLLEEQDESATHNSVFERWRRDRRS
mmetsp:Transcript_24420/g.44271  ORF Transcript_24420/g.44271 Transcript_24420/m.44271 type:complete len:549 (+) Transcript_24420:79-1725(+)